jgi:peptidoglycan/xylan/chitin deacetylase (PgdA/CDA1 family)
MVFCLIGSVAFAGPVTNLVWNGGFETGTTVNGPDGWQLDTWGSITSTMTYPVTGQTGRGVKITVANIAATTPGDSGAALTFGDTHNIPVKAGQRFVYQDATKCTARMQLDAQYRLSNGTFAYQVLTATTVANNTWVPTVAYLIVPAGAVSMSIYRVADKVGSCTIDNVSVYQTRGYVTLSFDDGYLQTAAVTLLNKYGVKGMFYLNSRPILGGWVGYFTPAQVWTIARQGHGIGSHTVDHVSLPSLPDASVIAEVRNDKTTLEAMAKVPVTSFAYPYGDYSARVQALVASVGLTTARGVNDGLNPAPRDLFGLQATCPEKTTTMPQLLSLVDTAVTANGWRIMCFHGIDSLGGQYDTTPATLETFIRYVLPRARIVLVKPTATQ